MPAFYLLVVLMVIFIWFCCIQYYESIGRWLRDWFDETKEIMTKDENDNEKE